jgi:hypothetical protein
MGRQFVDFGALRTLLDLDEFAFGTLIMTLKRIFG